MKSVRVTDRRAAECVAVLLDEDVSAVQEVEDMEREQAEVDRLMESVDRELAAEGRRAAARLSVDTSDGQWVRRARRRAERAAVRSLRTPVVGVEQLGEAA